MAQQDQDDFPEEPPVDCGDSEREIASCFGKVVELLMDNNPRLTTDYAMHAALSLFEGFVQQRREALLEQERQDRPDQVALAAEMEEAARLKRLATPVRQTRQRVRDRAALERYEAAAQKGAVIAEFAADNDLGNLRKPRKPLSTDRTPPEESGRRIIMRARKRRSAEQKAEAARAKITEAREKAAMEVLKKIKGA
ncbi:MAG: hypothetical protein U1E21_05925 [Reyranellaceae bacterium]